MTSLWRDGRAPIPSDVLTSERCDDVVVGAGITGLTTALLLARAGRDVVVLEARDVGSVATGNTTAKVPMLQGTKYNTLLRRHPVDVASALSRSCAPPVAGWSPVPRPARLGDRPALGALGRRSDVARHHRPGHRAAHCGPRAPLRPARAQRSYALAFDHPDPPDLMLISAHGSSRSVRDAPGDGSARRLLVGGEGHTVGRGWHEQGHLDRLRQWTAEHFPQAVETHHWSAQDYTSTDALPRVGLLPRWPCPGRSSVTRCRGRSVCTAGAGASPRLWESPGSTRASPQPEWNDADQSYDCPLHGSRFAPTGGSSRDPPPEPCPCATTTIPETSMNRRNTA